MTQDEGWSYLNQLEHAPARIRGRIRDVEKVDTIVIHRMGDLTAKNGVRYVQSLGDGRKVSWHATVDARTGHTWRHLPVSRVGAHCKYPEGTNTRSVGIEIGGPFESDISDAAHAALARLCAAYCAVAPIKRICSHQWLDLQGPRRNRKDPGPKFKWECLSACNVDLVYVGHDHAA